jgi:predicted transcriptional regulator
LNQNTGSNGGENLDKDSLSHLKSISIQEAAPHIFRRPLLDITPETPLSQLAVFLATGSRIYVDGIIVLVKGKPVGRIGSLHILRQISSNSSSNWSKIYASNVMESSEASVEATDPISKLLTIFGQTKFAFAPVMMKGRAATSITIRDLLHLIGDAKISEPCKTLSSPLVKCSSDINLQSVIDLMFRENVRNMVVEDQNCKFVVTDRKILEFLFSPAVKHQIQDGKTLDEFSVVALDPDSAPPILTRELDISQSAELLTSLENSFLLFEDSILTPWDVIMKTIGKESLTS